MADILKFTKNKNYSDFGNLLVDISKEYSHIQSGIIVLFDEEGGINVLPCCTKSQCSFAAADLLRKATE